MHGFMGYTKDQAKLLQEIFRHKLVHLAEPKAVARHKGKLVTWRYHHHDASQHLQLVTPASPVTQQVTPGLSVQIEQEFVVCIEQLVKDVTESVRRTGAYRDRLKTDSGLHTRFEKAISQIYGVK